MVTLPEYKEHPKIFFTCDSQFCPHQIMDFYKEADIIVHDCETGPYKSGVHAHITELETLPDEIKKKMWLTHYQDNVVDSWDEWNNRVHKQGFKGFVKKGTVWEF
jgi:ribonuclease BN (tRNA processing enzyme)